MIVVKVNAVTINRRKQILDGRSQYRYVYDNLAIVSDGYRVSSSATAAIVNAAWEDMRILWDENNFMGESDEGESAGWQS